MGIQSEIRKLLPMRKPESHKGTYGRVFILAGSRGLSGACLLSAKAALRSGAGLVTVGVPESLVLPLSRRLLEAMTKGFAETGEGTLDTKAFPQVMRFLESQDVFALGPGLSVNPSTAQLVRKLVSTSRKPMVIDADGLNAFIGKTPRLKKRKAEAILTPHPGEFVRLFSGPIPRGDKERVKRARVTAKKFGAILVLKGNRTVVASPDGKVFINPTGNPGMATGGSGDVLLGVIAALLGQGLKPFDAAKVGVYLHGFAGDLAAKKVGEISLVAGDLIEFLPLAFRKVFKH